jgi:hypothetical protein
MLVAANQHYPVPNEEPGAFATSTAQKALFIIPFEMKE